MARPIGLSGTSVSAVRTKTGSPILADDASLVDANYSPTPSETLGGAVECFGCETIWLGAELVAGTSVVVEILVRDPDAADGSRWKRPLTAAGAAATVYTFTTAAQTGMVEVQVDGALIFPRITTVNGAVTSAILLARPGRMQARRAFR